MILMRVVSSALVAAVSWISLAACAQEGTDAASGETVEAADDMDSQHGAVAESGSSGQTVNLNNHEEFAAWEDPINAKCANLETAEDRQLCGQDEMVGTTLTMNGPVIDVLTVGDLPYVSIMVGSDNPRLQPIAAVWVNSPLPYGMSFTCDVNLVPACAGIKEGDSVDVAAAYVNDPLPDAGGLGMSLRVESIATT